jgi:hypothetical protein
MPRTRVVPTVTLLCPAGSVTDNAALPSWATGDRPSGGASGRAGKSSQADIPVSKPSRNGQKILEGFSMPMSRGETTRIGESRAVAPLPALTK